MSDDAKEPQKKKTQSAKDVAEAMAANMAANMKDPEKFWTEHDQLEEEVRKKVLSKSNLRETSKEK